jgi:hypothetical protein
VGKSVLKLNFDLRAIPEIGPECNLGRVAHPPLLLPYGVLWPPRALGP